MTSVKRTNRTILFILYLLAYTAVQAQNVREVTNIAAQLGYAMLFNSQYPQEKVYLHFDNTGYFKGERIWYKAYVVRADNGMPTDISRVLYVELVTPGGEVVATQKLPIKNGTAYGDLSLENILSSGYYEVRAYTRYMTNWGSDYVFSRVFPVFNAPQTKGDYSHMVIDRTDYRRRLPDNLGQTDAETAADSQDKRDATNVRFYPEGGELVRGIRSRVAFVVTGGNSKDAITGIVGNTLCDSLDCVSTDSCGRGVFEIVPDSTLAFFSLRDGRGKIRQFPLPQPKEEGCVLLLDAVHGDGINIRISSSANICGNILGYALLHNGNIVECDTFTASSSFTRTFKREDIPTGVSQLTVFDGMGRIQADRLFFVCPSLSPEEGGIHIAAATERLSPCGKVKLLIDTSPNSHISLSAADYSTMTGGKRGNMYTWMLLSSG